MSVFPPFFPTLTPRTKPRLRLKRRLLTAGAALVLTPLAAAASTNAQRPVDPGRMSLTATYLPTYVANFESGLRQFDSTPWNNQPYAPTLVTWPTLDGHYAGRYVIPAGGHRSESVPHLRSFHEGDDLWFSWATRLGADFPVSANTWQVVDQWKNAGIGSPPLEIGVSAGNFYIDGGYGWPGNTSAIHPRLDRRLLGRARTNVWDRWTAHIRFYSNAKYAAVSVRRNGVAVVTGWHPRGGTLYPRLTSYLKVGYYRDPAIRTQGTVYEDRLKVGSTYGAVA